MSVYVIADIGINHNGDIGIVKKLINVAAFAGCDCVKFQKRDPDISVPEHQKDVMRGTPWGEMSYLDYKKRIELEEDDYKVIDIQCSIANIQWSASVWDIPSLEFIASQDVPFIKIPSAHLTNDELLKAAASYGKKIILSTGMSSLEEIDHAVDIVRGPELALMHCNSSYPAKVEELNLKCIQTLKDRYGCEVGYSGHEYRTGPTVSTVFLGATIIERHITLDRLMWGTDQMASVEPEGLITMVRAIRDLEEAIGNGEKVVTESEMEIRKKLRGV